MKPLNEHVYKSSNINQISISELIRPLTLAQLVCAWLIVGVFHIYGAYFLREPLGAAVAIFCFIILFATIITASFGVVRQADHLAQQLGEPYGTIILTLSIVLIEVILIASILLGPGEFPTIGRDAIFAVMMIILNLVTGLCLLFGGLRHQEQAYNAQGANTYLSMIIVLTGLALVLPNYVAGSGEFSFVQAVAFSTLTIVLYGFFLWFQIGQYSRLFIQPDTNLMAVAFENSKPLRRTGKLPPKLDRRALILRSLLMVLMILPIVLLSHDLAILIDHGIEMAKAPIALGGVLIAIIVFTPEAITAVKAALNNEMQRAINLCLGAFVSTIGLTVPAVLVIGLVTGKTVIMGVSVFETVLLILTIALTALSFNGQRTSPIQGIMHLGLFGVFTVLLFSV